ncbi:unnamed protein product [Spirodela intermedia]|uniref:Uncharacterized protein n=1 Tax=Spirodela intermedia TaxID=51605 RepID=A0A7I8KI43_SPIIN|nr:unnamed protein product [Spirodela intermedia]
MASKNNFCHQKKEKQKINNVDNAREVNTHKRLIIMRLSGHNQYVMSRGSTDGAGMTRGGRGLETGTT